MGPEGAPRRIPAISSDSMKEPCLDMAVDEQDVDSLAAHMAKAFQTAVVDLHRPVAYRNGIPPSLCGTVDDLHCLRRHFHRPDVEDALIAVASIVVADVSVDQIMPQKSIGPVAVPRKILLSGAPEDIVRTGWSVIVVHFPVKAVFKCFAGFQRIESVLPAALPAPAVGTSVKESVRLREKPFVVIRIGNEKIADLPHVRHAADVSGLVSRLAERRKQKRRENGDDRYFIDLRKYFFYVCLCQWRIGKGLMIPIDTNWIVCCVSLILFQCDVFRYYYMFGRKNKAMRFTSCNKQGVISEAGFRFYSIDRFHFGYQEDDHTVILIVERGIGVTKIYCEDLAWTYPFENEIIPPQKKDEIIKNIQESLRFMNIQYEIVK